MTPEAKLQAAAWSGRPLQRIDDIVGSLKGGIAASITDAESTVESTACPASGCNRVDDESPWNAGGFIGSPTNNWICSSGFGVYKWSPSQTQYQMLTAAHCGSAGDYFTDLAGEYIGHINLDDWDRDVATLNAPGWYWMWDGDQYSSVHKTVKSYGYQVNGELLCQSGRHGVRCDLQTQDGFYTIWCSGDSDGDAYYMHWMNKAVRTTGAEAALPGDSGGPVFSLDGAGVRAKGIVSARSGPNNSWLYYSGMSNIIDRNGWYPRLG